MQLTRAGEYGVRFVLFLARQEPGTLFNRKTICQAMEIPYQFSGKVANFLVKAGLVNVEQGAGGGYRLARGPEEITLLDVIEAVEGEIHLNKCLLGEDVCCFQPGCSVHLVWESVQKNLKDSLSSASFADLAGSVRQSNGAEGA